MTTPGPRAPSPTDPRDRWLRLGVALLAVLVSLTALRNQFPLDDKPIIVENPFVTTPALWRGIFTASYWPATYAADLYRPLTTLWLMLQRWAGSGRPEVHHAVSLLLYAVCAALTYTLCRRVAGVGAALVAALLFAVHPVHVEAVAASVNQAELVVGALGAVMVLLWLRVRARGLPSPAANAGLALLYLLACGTKESGVMLLGLVGAAELLLVDDGTPALRRLLATRRTWLLLLLVAVAFIAARATVLDDVVGTFTAETLRGQRLGGRALTMLGAMPVLARLLAWPDDPKIDYSPTEIVRADAFGGAQALGLVLVLGVAATLAWSWRRRPAVAFGLAWFAITYFPVSNVLIPTGIVLAERTLLAPTMGLALALGSGLDALGARLQAGPRALRFACAGTLAALVTLGALETARAHRAWYGTNTLFRDAVERGTRSYRVYWQFGLLLRDLGKYAEARALIQRAIAIHQDDPFPWMGLASAWERDDRCDAAIPVYDLILRRRPDMEEARAHLASCLAWEARYDEARRVARVGAAHGPNDELFARMAQFADSAARLGRPRHSVNLEALIAPHARARYSTLYTR
ncbi:MAG: tetratricopeptide repeat protein [Gemmatimonadales bacterium]|nr:tetratricopeptide repeat protein [Gemmatimonadales bacterium]